MGIKHNYQSASANDGTKEVSSTRWNENHVIDSEITLPVVANPATPAANFLNLFVRNVGGRLLAAIVGPSGMDASIQPHLGRQKAAWWQPLGNSAAVPLTTGFAAATLFGTVTARIVASTNLLTTVKRLGFVSAATAGSLAGIYFSIAQYFKSNGAGLGGFHSIFRFGTSDASAVSGARAFIGWAATVAAPTNVEPNTLTNCFGLAQLSADATQWYVVYGGSAAQTAIPLGIALGAPTLTNTLWDVAFYDFPNSANLVGYTVTNVNTGVSVSGTLTGVAGTVLPAALTALAPRVWRSNNATALAVGIDISSIYAETDD